MRTSVFGAIGCLLFFAGHIAVADGSRKPGEQVVQAVWSTVRSSSGALGGEGLMEPAWWKVGFEAFEPIGGIVLVRILDAGNGRPGENSIVLVNWSLFASELPAWEDSLTRPQIYLFSDRQSSVIGIKTAPIHGRIVGRNSSGSAEYLDMWGARGAPFTYSSFRVRQGQLVCRAEKQGPTENEAKEKEETLSAKAYSLWRQEAVSLPAGFKQWEPNVWWLPLAEIVRSRSPRWRTGQDYAVPERLAAERKAAADFTWKEFSRWITSPPFKPSAVEWSKPIHETAAQPGSR